MQREEHELAFAPLALGVLGAATSAIGTIASGEAQANAANYNAQVARNNATIALQNAQYSREAGQEKAAQTSMQGAAEEGQIKAGLAANNVDVNTGSAVNVETGAREESELNSQTALNNAELQAYGYTSQATGYQAQAGLEQTEAEEAPIGADIGAAGGLLSNASALGFRWTGGSGSSNSGGGYGTGNQGPELVGVS